MQKALVLYDVCVFSGPAPYNSKIIACYVLARNGYCDMTPLYTLFLHIRSTFVFYNCLIWFGRMITMNFVDLLGLLFSQRLSAVSVGVLLS